MNDLVKFSGGSLPADPSSLAAGLQNVGTSIQSGGGVPFLKLSKSGRWMYGAEAIEVEEGSNWAINPYSIEHGFACWGDGELLGEVMVPFNQAPPPISELADYGKDWDQQMSVQLQCLDGEDAGTTVLYKGTSLGLRTAMKGVINELLTQLQKDQTNIVPAVVLEVDSYKHKKYGEIFTPSLEIVSWLSMTGDAAEEEPEKIEEKAAEPELEEVEEEPKARRGRRSAKAAATEEAEDVPQEEAKPARRRRRRAAS